MPTSHTMVTLFNLALDVIVEQPISTISDNSAYARWLNRNFAPTVEAALRQQPWNFACEFFQLSQDVPKPAFRWHRQFTLPPDWLRVLPLTEGGYRNGRPIPHEVKSNKLLTNASSPVPVELVMNRQNPGDWDPLFATMIAGRLAAGMAHRFTGKTSFLEKAQQMAKEAFEEAEQANAFEGSLMPVEQFDIIRVRGGDSQW